MRIRSGLVVSPINEGMPCVQILIGTQIAGIADGLQGIMQYQVRSLSHNPSIAASSDSFRRSTVGPRKLDRGSRNDNRARRQLD